MPKILDEELVTIQLRLFKSDHEALKRLHGQDFGINRPIRAIIRSYVRHVRAGADAMIDQEEASAAKRAMESILAEENQSAA